MLDTVDVKKVLPKGKNVLVEIKQVPKATSSGIIVGTTNQFSSSRLDIDNYTGTITGIGDNKEIAKYGLKEGDKVIFSQYSGYHVPTSRKTFAKLIKFTDVHCKIQDDMKLELKDAQPMGDRLLLEVIVEEDMKTEAGIIVPKSSEQDPRQLDSTKCRVQAISADLKYKGYEVGDTVYIPEYVGNTVILDDGMMVKTVNHDDVLFVYK